MLNSYLIVNFSYFVTVNGCFKMYRCSVLLLKSVSRSFCVLVSMIFSTLKLNVSFNTFSPTLLHLSQNWLLTLSDIYKRITLGHQFLIIIRIGQVDPLFNVIEHLRLSIHVFLLDGAFGINCESLESI
jgi:hypothetical protein